MTKKKGAIMLLLVLVVVLLVIVSSRLSPPLPAGQTTDLSDPEQTLYTPLPNAGANQTDEPEQTPEPTVDPRDLLPDVSIYDWNLKLVNNVSVLSSSFAPDVTAIDDGQYFDSRAVDALNSLLSAVKAQGFSVYISAAYRPYSTQAYLFYGKASQIAWGGTVEYAEAEMMARELVAYPGTSEHQLGLCVDLIDSANTAMVAEEVEDMPLLVWLREHCAAYGFILRYPKDKEEITGWYEPWHFRYVGQEAAAYIMENGLCLEEFIGLYQ